MTSPPITIEQYLGFKAPPGFRDELIQGEIVLSPDPKPYHTEICHRIEKLLTRSVAGSDFVVRQRTNVKMGRDYSMPSPDVFVMRRERWWAAIEADTYPSGSPELAIEVISPSNRRTRIEQKVSLYLKNGASGVWVVFPKRRALKVFGQGPRDYERVEGQTLELPPPLPMAAIPVSEIFQID